VKRLLIILTLALPIAGLSQNLTISARIQDNETHEQLGFASVGIKGVPIGTISNNLGEFDFHFPAQYRNDILVISMMGYKNFEAPVWTLLNNPALLINLEKSSIELQEIVVSDTLVGGDVLRIALSRVEQNYPMQPFMMEGFYRDIKKVGGTYISLLEAAVKIYDENYEEPRNKERLRERVRLIEVRRSLGYESKFTKYFDQGNLLEDLLLHNSIRYHQIEQAEDFFSSVHREKTSFYDQHAIYAVAYTSEFYDLRVFIDKEDFSIIHLEWETKNANDKIGKKKNMMSRFVALKKNIDFRRHAGKMHLSYMSITSKVNWYDVETNELKFETELFQQLMINKIDPNPVDRIKSNEAMRNYGLQYQDQPYNKEFWNNYNVIKETPLDKKILQDLEQQESLDKQFEGN
jgi:hypothetical protein